MQKLQDNKIFVVTQPGAILDNTPLTTQVIDTKGYDELAVYVIIGSIDAAMTALNLTESNAAGSGFVAMEGADFSTGSNLPGATADNTVYGFFVDLRGHKRYVDVVATAGDGAAGAYITIIAVLGKAKQTPITAAGRGLAKDLVV